MAWWSRTPGGNSPHKFALLGNRITGCRPRPDWHSAANANADHLDGLRDTDTESRSRPRTVLPQAQVRKRFDSVDKDSETLLYGLRRHFFVARGDVFKLRKRSSVIVSDDSSQLPFAESLGVFHISR